MRNDMGIGEWGEQRDRLVAHRHPAGAAWLDNATPMDRIPHQDRMTQETQATRLGHHLLIVPGLQRPLIRKKAPARKRMAERPPVERTLDRMAAVHVRDIAQDRAGLAHAAQGGQGLGQPI